MDDRDQAKQIVARSYDLIAERHAEWASGIRQEERLRFASLLTDALPKGCALLELGCGTAGPITQLLAGHFRLTGVDISPRSIAIARNAVPTARFVVSDMTEIEFSSCVFDGVAAFYSIIHIPREELHGLFSRIFSWLRPGGLFVGTLNGSDTPGTFEDNWLGARMFWSGYDPITTRRLLDEVGFIVESLTFETAEENGDSASFWWLVARRPPDAIKEHA